MTWRDLGSLMEGLNILIRQKEGVTFFRHKVFKERYWGQVMSMGGVESKKERGLSWQQMSGSAMESRFVGHCDWLVEEASDEYVVV